MIGMLKNILKLGFMTLFHREFCVGNCYSLWCRGCFERFLWFLHTQRKCRVHSVRPMLGFLPVKVGFCLGCSMSVNLCGVHEEA